MRRLLPYLALLLCLAATATAKDYYAAPLDRPGTGTATDPYGLPDLWPNGFPGPACKALAPGDTLYLYGGNYYQPTRARAAYEYGAIVPGVSGTPAAPIVIRSVPGEVAHLYGTGQCPIVGNKMYGDKVAGRTDFKILRLCLHQTGVQPAIRLIHTTPDAANVEIGFCRVTGADVSPLGDNHNGIRVDYATDTYVHDTEVSNVKGGGLNSAGIMEYNSLRSRYERCYVHDCNTGIFSKQSNTGTLVKDSVIVRNSQSSIRGNILSTYDGSIEVQGSVTDQPVTNPGGPSAVTLRHNLFLCDKPWIGSSISLPQHDLIFDANVVLGVTLKVQSELRNGTWSDDLGKPVTSWRGNLYASRAAGTPAVAFAVGAYNPPVVKLTPLDVPQKVDQESVVSTGGPADLWVPGTYTLLPKWHDGFADVPGPADVDALLDESRYGPEAPGVIVLP